jgi:opacity protein-like surface antigen
MTNKTTKICCTLALLASVATTPALSQTKNFAGPSIAIGGTAISTQTNTKVSDELNSTSADFGKAQNLIPSIDLSYSAAISNKFLLGFGVRYDLAKNKSGTVNSDFTTNDVINGSEDNDSDTTYFLSDIRNIESYNISYKDHYAAYIMPTYLVNNSTGVFAKLGYHKQKGSLNYLNTQTVNASNPSVVEAAEDPTGTTPARYVSGEFTASGSKNFEGWGYGLGLKTLLTDNLFLQIEAEFIDYKSKSITGTDDLVYNFKPESLAGTISVGYKF